MHSLHEGIQVRLRDLRGGLLEIGGGDPPHRRIVVNPFQEHRRDVIGVRYLCATSSGDDRVGVVAIVGGDALATHASGRAPDGEWPVRDRSGSRRKGVLGVGVGAAGHNIEPDPRKPFCPFRGTWEATYDEGGKYGEQESTRGELGPVHAGTTLVTRMRCRDRRGTVDAVQALGGVFGLEGRMVNMKTLLQ